MEDGRQWYIEPTDQSREHARSRREANPYTIRDRLEHVLLPHSELVGHLASHISDGNF